MTTSPLRRAGVAVAATLLALTGCGTNDEELSVDGTIVDLHEIRATIQKKCEMISTVPYMEECKRVKQPDHCFVFVENTDPKTDKTYFVRGEVYCDAYDSLKEGGQFRDGTDVIASECFVKDENGRWDYGLDSDCPGGDDFWE